MKAKFPIIFFSNELTDKIKLVKRVLQLELHALRDFHGAHNVRRQPVSSGQQLPDMPRLPKESCLNFEALISYIINFHFQQLNITKNLSVIAHDQQSNQIVVYYCEGCQAKIISDLEQIEKIWLNEVFPPLSKWQFISGENKIYFQCRNYAYVSHILSSCLVESIASLTKRYGLEVLPSPNQPDYFLYQMNLKAQSFQAFSLEKDLESHKKFFTDTGIRIDYQRQFIVDIHNYCGEYLHNDNYHSELTQYISIILGHLQAYQKTQDIKQAYTRIKGIYALAIQKNENIQHSNSFAIVNTYCSMYQIADYLNEYADCNNNYTVDDEGALCMAVNAEKFVQKAKINVEFNTESISPVSDLLCNLSEKLTDTDITVEKLKAMYPNIKGVLDYFTQSELSKKAQLDMSNLLYLKFFLPLTEFITGVQHQSGDGSGCQNDVTLEAVLKLSYQICKKTTKMLSDKMTQEDCYYYEFAFLKALLLYYQKSKMWDLSEDCLVHIDTLGKKLQGVDNEISLVTFHAYQIRVQTSLARDCLTEAIRSYHSCIKFFDTKLKDFTKFKPNKLMEKIKAYKGVFSQIMDLADLSKAMAASLSANGMHQLAVQIMINAQQKLHHRFRVLTEFFEKAPKQAGISYELSGRDKPKSFVDNMSNTLMALIQDYEHRHLLSLIEVCPHIKDHELFFTVNQTKSPVGLSIIPVNGSDTDLFKRTLKNHNISYVLISGALNLNNLSDVNTKIFHRALSQICNAKKIQVAQQNQTQDMVAPVQLLTDTPSYDYFLNLDEPVVTKKITQSKQSQKPKKTTEPKRAPQAPKLIVNFGEAFGEYNENITADQPIVALQDNYRPFGVFFGRIDPSVTPDVQKQFRKALTNRGPNKGNIVSGKGNQGVKFFKKGGEKSWKIKIPGQDEFLEGHIATTLLERDQHGMPIRRFLINFDTLKNHAQEQREQKYF